MELNEIQKIKMALLVMNHADVDERANAALDNKTGVQQSLLDSLNYLTHKYCVNG